MSEAKSPSFGAVFDTVWKVFLAIILLIMILVIGAFTMCAGIMGGVSSIGGKPDTSKTSVYKERTGVDLKNTPLKNVPLLKLDTRDQRLRNLKMWGFEGFENENNIDALRARGYCKEFNWPDTWTDEQIKNYKRWCD